MTPPHTTPCPAPARRRAGFTLIEVLAAVLLTSIVLTVALSIFMNLSEATEKATSRMREARHAIAILDRIAQDLESAFLLVKPAAMDPIDHPWIFLAESDYSGGADRLKFVVRNHQRRSSTGRSSDLAVVTYALASDSFGTFNLLRSVTPNLPSRLERDIPVDEDQGALLLAEGIESFSVRFLGQGDSWVDRWDSSQLANSGDLPVAAEIQISFADPDARDAYDAGYGDEEFEQEALLYKRMVAIPMRPVPLQKIIEKFKKGGEEPEVVCEEGEMTQRECVDLDRNRERFEKANKPIEEMRSKAIGCLSIGTHKFDGVEVVCQP